MAQLGLKIPHLDPQMPNIGPALAQLTRKETIKKISLERGPQGERGPRARARKVSKNESHSRARADPFHPKDPFQRKLRSLHHKDPYDAVRFAQRPPWNPAP